MNGHELYQIFLGMKLHFTQKGYDYTKYGPRKVDEAKIGKYYVLCGALSRKFKTKEDLEVRLVSLFKNKVVWLNEISTPEAEKAHRIHQGDLQNLEYNFSKDLSLIQEYCPDIIQAFKVESNFDIPLVSKMLINKEIHIETYCILDYLLDFSKTTNDLVFGAEKLRIEKYKKFFKPSLNPFARQLKSCIINTE